MSSDHHFHNHNQNPDQPSFGNKTIIIENISREKSTWKNDSNSKNKQ